MRKISVIANNIFWSMLETGVQQIMNFIIGIVLARILFPEDYGLVGIAYIIIEIGNTLIDSGYSSSLIRTKIIKKLDYSTVFVFNILVATILYAILFISASKIGSFFKEPDLVLIIKILSSVLIINSFTLVQKVTLTKNLNFRALTISAFFSNAFSGIIAIVFALKGLGVWSLVFKSILNSFIQVLMLSYYSKWQPSIRFELKTLIPHFRYGSKLLVNELMNTGFRSIIPVIIAKFLSIQQVGFYNRALGYVLSMSKTVLVAINKVSFVHLSNHQDDKNRMIDLYKKFNRLSFIIITPLLIGLAVAADNLIIVFIKEKWLPVVPIIRILCVAYLISPMVLLGNKLFEALGRSDLRLQLETLKKILSVALILGLMKWGLTGLVIAQGSSYFLSGLLNVYYVQKLVGYTAWRQIYDLLPILGISVITGLVTFLIKFFYSGQNFISIVLMLSGGISMYFILIYVLKFPERNTLLGLLKKKPDDSNKFA